MAKRFYISLLAIVFFVSTTSLPISIHLCSMMGKSDAETCKMCAAEKAETKTCCNDDNNSLQFNKAGSKCCSDKLIDSSVKENYISSANSFKDLNTLKYLSAIIIPADVVVSNISVHFTNVHSPPLITNNPVYLINSVFLI